MFTLKFQESLETTSCGACFSRNAIREHWWPQSIVAGGFRFRPLPLPIV